MSNVVLTLPEVFKIDAVEAVRDQMVTVLEEADQIEIQGSSVEAVDFCALQLLVAFVQAVGVADISLKWLGHSEPLREAITDMELGLTLGSTQ